MLTPLDRYAIKKKNYDSLYKGISEQFKSRYTDTRGFHPRNVSSQYSGFAKLFSIRSLIPFLHLVTDIKSVANTISKHALQSSATYFIRGKSQ